MFYHLSRTCFYFTITILLLSCSYIEMNNSQWNRSEILDILKLKQLAVEDVREPRLSEPLWSDEAKDIIIFTIPPTNNSELVGIAYVYIFDSTSAANSLLNRRSQTNKSFPDFPILLFSHDNLYVEMYGDISETTLQKYKQAILSLKK